MSESKELKRKQIYHKLLSDLNNRIVPSDEDNTNQVNFMLTAKTYLQPRQLASKNFLQICDNLEMKGKLGPCDLVLLHTAFRDDDDSIKLIDKAKSDIQNIAKGLFVLSTTV